MERNYIPEYTATTEQLFGTKKFPITKANGEQRPTSAILHVIFMRYMKENKLEFEIGKAEITRFNNGVEVFHTACGEDTRRPTARIVLKGGSKELEDGSFILEKGVKVGVEFMNPNEVNENCVASLWTILDNPYNAKDPMHLFLHVLDELQETIIMKPGALAKATPEGMLHILEILRQAGVDMDMTAAQFLAEHERIRLDVILRFVHKMIKIVEEEMSQKTLRTAQQPLELQRKVPEVEQGRPIQEPIIQSQSAK